MSIVPRISFKHLVKKDDEALKSLSIALEDHGFFSIKDHGLSKELIDACYEKSIDFFNLSNDKKIKYSFPNNAGARGYTPFGKETALGEKVPDLKEFWHHGPIIDKSFDDRIKKNIYISEIDQFNETFDRLFIELNNFGIELLSCIALSIGLEKNYFSKWVDKGNSLLRMIHYPPSDNSNIFRAREHSDINLITLLIGANERGLEVKSKDTSWIKIQAEDDDIVCNIGDMLQLVTDGLLKSTPHRVIKYQDQSSSSRYSIPFFLHPSPNIMLKSVFNKDDDGVLADDFLNDRLKAIKLY
jgi:isopenicillin N synthase-like dioxygenase